MNQLKRHKLVFSNEMFKIGNLVKLARSERMNESIHWIEEEKKKKKQKQNVLCNSIFIGNHQIKNRRHYEFTNCHDIISVFSFLFLNVSSNASHLCLFLLDFDCSRSRCVFLSFLSFSSERCPRSVCNLDQDMLKINGGILNNN